MCDPSRRPLAGREHGRTIPSADSGPQQHLGPRLVQPRAAKAFQIVLPFSLVLDRHLLADPAERDIGLGAAQLL